MYKKTILKNGLRIITVPMKGTRAVTVLLLVGTGSKYETKEINGISHFLEHMFFKGTKKRPSTLTISETLDKVGGIYNAFTGEEYTGWFAKVNHPHLDLVLDWISDIFLNSKLEQNQIEKEKGVIIEEINMYFDSPKSYVLRLWNKLLYGDQPAGWDVAGTKESVAKINRKKLLSYFTSQYVTKNTVIGVAGKISHSETIKKIEKYFKKIKKGEFREKPAVREKQSKPATFIQYRKTDQTHLLLGVRGYNLFHPQIYAYELLGIILGGMMSSRLFISLREKKGLAYYIHTEADSDTDTGCLVTRAGVRNRGVEEAIKIILEGYRRVSREIINPKELDKAKDCLKGRMALALEASETVASFYGSQELLEKKIMTPRGKYDKIDKVTSQDIQKVAQDIFKPEKLNLALIGPFKDKKRFKKLLKI